MKQIMRSVFDPFYFSFYRIKFDRNLDDAKFDVRKSTSQIIIRTLKKVKKSYELSLFYCYCVREFSQHTQQEFCYFKLDFYWPIWYGIFYAVTELYHLVRISRPMVFAHME